MKDRYTKHVELFSRKAFLFDDNSAVQKLQTLKALHQTPLKSGEALLTHHASLLFTLTHPQSNALLALARKDLKRMAAHLKKGNNAAHPALADSGLPFTTITSRFTPEVFNDLVKNKQVSITLESLENPQFDLNAFCNISFPRVLKEETTAGLSNDDLLDLLGVPNEHKFEWLLQEINNMQTSPLAKDFFWQALQSFFTIKASHASFSKSYNCIAVEKMHLTTSLTRQVDAQALLQQPIGAPLKLTKQVHDRVVEVIKNTMTLSMREIDPATYMQTKSLRLYPLENGLSMAIYGLVPERQLPLQSYVGYTLFKNGYPISYGGAWVLGRWSLFALNVFEEYRGGESKYVMTQILRVYAQVFGVHCFEVEPFQFGNEDAIKTGAFWFYYKFGFRPLNKTTLALANSEVAKMAKNKAYRSNEKILTQLANGNIALLLSDDKYTHRNAVIEPISQLIAGRYKGNHMAAIADAKNFFINHAPLLKKWNKDEETVFEEMALWAYAHRITQKDTLAIMIKMIQSKPKDFIAYNNLVKQII